MKSIGIIGFGNVGRAIYLKVMSGKHLCIDWICSSHLMQSNTLIYKKIKCIETIPDFIFITENDNKIEIICQELFKEFGEKLKDKYVIHCSGISGLELLRSVDGIAKIVAAHPFQTFHKDYLSAEILEDIAWGVQCANEDFPEVVELITELGGKAFLLPNDVDKALYHSVAVVASNYLLGTLQLAKLLADKVDIARNDFLIPIIKQSVKNYCADLEKFPLTGPIARGDLVAVNKHLGAIKEENLRESYRYLELSLLKILEIE